MLVIFKDSISKYGLNLENQLTRFLWVSLLHLYRPDEKCSRRVKATGSALGGTRKAGRRDLLCVNFDITSIWSYLQKRVESRLLQGEKSMKPVYSMLKNFRRRSRRWSVKELVCRDPAEKGSGHIFFKAATVECPRKPIWVCPNSTWVQIMWTLVFMHAAPQYNNKRIVRYKWVYGNGYGRSCCLK